VACTRVSTGAYDDIQRATDLAYKAVAEYGLSLTIGPMSVPTLSSGGAEDSFFGGGSTADTTNRQVAAEVQETLTSARYVAMEQVQSNLAVLRDIDSNLSEKEKIGGAELQVWLDRVVPTPLLERFLRGENPLPPAGSSFYNQLPLPKFLPPPPALPQ